MMASIHFTTNDTKLNLLPAYYKKELQLKRTFIYTIIIAILIITVAVTASVFLHRHNISLVIINAEYEALLNSRRYEGADTIYNDIQSLQSQLFIYDEILAEINDPDLITHINLYDIFSHIPAGVSAQTVTIDALNSKVTFSGIAEERDKISVFTESLMSSEEYEGVTLKSLSTAEDGKIKFGIVFLFAGGGAEHG